MTGYLADSADGYLMPAAEAKNGAMPEGGVAGVLAGFFRAQKQEFAGPRHLSQGISLILVDDDHSLVNSFVAVEDGDLIRNCVMLSDIAAEWGLDPARTEIIVPGVIAPHLVRDCQRNLRGTVRRVVRLTDFLDGFLRPGRICATLKKAGIDEPNSPDGLLYEADFIEPAAIGEGTGKFPAMRHLFTGWARGGSPRLCMLLAPAGY